MTSRVIKRAWTRRRGRSERCKKCSRYNGRRRRERKEWWKTGNFSADSPAFSWQQKWEPLLNKCKRRRTSDSDRLNIYCTLRGHWKACIISNFSMKNGNINEWEMLQQVREDDLQCYCEEETAHCVNVWPIKLQRTRVGWEADRNTVEFSLECTTKVWGEGIRVTKSLLSCASVGAALTHKREPDNYVQHHAIFFLHSAFQSLISPRIFVLFPLNCVIQLFLHPSAEALIHCAALCEWSLLIANLPQINFRMREDRERMERKEVELKG